MEIKIKAQLTRRILSGDGVDSDEVDDPGDDTASGCCILGFQSEKFTPRPLAPNWQLRWLRCYYLPMNLMGLSAEAGLGGVWVFPTPPARAPSRLSHEALIGRVRNRHLAHAAWRSGTVARATAHAELSLGEGLRTRRRIPVGKWLVSGRPRGMTCGVRFVGLL